MQPTTRKLANLIRRHHWRDKFTAAIENAHKYAIPQIRNVRSVEDFLRYVDELVTWAPNERGDARSVYDRYIELYFFLDQEPLKDLQTPIKPGKRPGKLTPLSAWLVEHAREWGGYLDTPNSAGAVDTFRNDPDFDWDEYMPPPSGYLTYNQFFGRHLKPGVRPVAAISDDRVIVSPADSTFVGQWPIGARSSIKAENQNLDFKGVRWSIHELLADSMYADCFAGGVFTHSFLAGADYHRWHVPVRGKVLETRVISGQAYLDVVVKRDVVDGKECNTLSAQDGTGYQFLQTRGLVVIESPIGLVACLPVGMAHVSSVVITAEVGKTLRKGEELGYFQFGGSDFVIVFERSSNVQLIQQVGVHYKQGTWIGNAYPPSSG